MSSYLNIYLKPRVKEGEEAKEPMLLASYSRNNSFYQAVYEELHVAYAGDDEKYTDIALDDWDAVKANLNKEIKGHKAYQKKSEYTNSVVRSALTDIVAKAANEITDRGKMHDIIEMVEEKISSRAWDNYEDEDYVGELESALSCAEFYSHLSSEMEQSWIDFEGICANID